MPPPIGTAHAEKLVVANWIGEVTIAPANVNDVRLAEVRTDADVRIAQVKAVRQVTTAAFICLTVVLALYSPVLAALVGLLGTVFGAYLARVQSLAETLVAGPTATATGVHGATTTAVLTGAVVSNAVLARVVWPLRYFVILVATVAFVVFVTPKAAELFRAPPVPSAPPLAPTTPAPPQPNRASPPGSDSSKTPPVRPPRKQRHLPSTEQERRVWSAFALLLDAELAKCDQKFDAGPGVYYARPFTLTCFQCPSDGVAQPLAEAETNAPKGLLGCYNNGVDGLLFQYVFPMPPRVEILDNEFTHHSR